MLKYSKHGFCKRKSYHKNLLKFFESVNQHIDRGDLVDIVYLDFLKAFDKIPLQILLSETSMRKRLQCLGLFGLEKRQERDGRRKWSYAWHGESGQRSPSFIALEIEHI